MQPEVFLNAVEEQDSGHKNSVGEIDADIKRLEGRRERVDSAEATAYSGYARGLASEEAYRRVRAELHAERQWIDEELKQKQAALNSARRGVITAETIEMLRPHLLERIQTASPEDKRFVLECLGVETTVGPSGVQLSLAVPESAMSAVYSSPGSTTSAWSAGRAGWVTRLRWGETATPVRENIEGIIASFRRAGFKPAPTIAIGAGQ